MNGIAYSWNLPSNTAQTRPPAKERHEQKKTLLVNLRGGAKISQSKVSFWQIYDCAVTSASRT